MREVWEELNVPLAEVCPAAEKAFELKTRGTVLGVGFNSSNLTWFLSEEKGSKIISRCQEVGGASHVGLKQLEKLMGSINDLGQMCQSVKYHRREENALLGQFRGDYHVMMY